MSAAQPLTTEQCEILAAILDPEATTPARTTDLLAKRVDMSPGEVASRLEELQARSPPLVQPAFDETWQVDAWMPTEATHEAYEAGCRT